MPDESKSPGNWRITQWILGVSALLAALVGAIKYGKELACLLGLCGPVATIEVSIDSPNAGQELSVGSVLVLKTILRDAAGTQLFGKPVSWTSDFPDVVQVSPQGLATAKKKGHAVITAANGTAQGLLYLHVGHIPVHSVSINPPQKNLAVRGQTTLEAVPKDSSGNTIDQSDSPNWNSEDDSVATVEASHGTRTGTVTAQKPGNAKIYATFDGLVGSADIVVEGPQPGQGQQPGGQAPQGGGPGRGAVVVPPPPPAGQAPQGGRLGSIIANGGKGAAIGALLGAAAKRPVRLDNQLLMNSCSESVQISIGRDFVTLQGPNQVFFPSQPGPTSYTVSGSIVCPGRRFQVFGRGTVNLQNGGTITAQFKMPSAQNAREVVLR